MENWIVSIEFLIVAIFGFRNMHTIAFCLFAYTCLWNILMNLAITNYKQAVTKNAYTVCISLSMSFSVHTHIYLSISIYIYI